MLVCLRHTHPHEVWTRKGGCIIGPWHQTSTLGSSVKPKAQIPHFRESNEAALNRFFTLTGAYRSRV